MNYLKMSRGIQDSVHGLISLTDEEMKVIDHPLFQRLRWIHQTGFLRLVATSATHTRFEHSIGVLAMAQKMLDALSRGSHASAAKLYALQEARPGQAVRFHELEPEVKGILQRATRLCALVHDLGHGPLSHVFDAFAPPVEEAEKMLSDPRLQMFDAYREHLLDSSTGRVSHEAVSCLFFAKLWSDLKGEDWMPAIVASVILNAPSDSHVPESLRPWVPFMRDLISSAPVDADRMDYLLRDSRAAGVTYGLYEPHRVLKSMLCMRAEDESGPIYRLGWRKSGLRAIEVFVHARFQMFVQMYYQKTNRAIELMLKAVIREFEHAKINLLDTSSLDSFVNGYLQLSDEWFLRLLRGEVRPGFPGNVRVEQLVRRIMERRLWKRIYDFDRDEVENAERLTAYLSEIFPEERLILDRQRVQALKDLEQGALLLRLDQHLKYSRGSYDRSWLEASPILRALREDENRSLVRLFIEVDDENEALAKHVRSQVHQRLLAPHLAPTLR